MKVAYFGEGDPAWFEPETPQDLEFLREAREKNWTLQRTLTEATQRGFIK